MPVPGQSSRPGLEMRTSRVALRAGDLQRRRVLGAPCRQPRQSDARRFLDPVFTRHASLSRRYAPARFLRFVASPRRAISAFTPEIRSAPCRCRRCPPLPAVWPRWRCSLSAGTAALVAAAPTARPSTSLAGGHQRGVRRWRQQRRAVHQRLHRALQQRDDGGRPVDAGRCSTRRPPGPSWTKRHQPDRLHAAARPSTWSRRPAGATRTHAAADPRRRRHDRHERNGRQGGAREEPGQPLTCGSDCDSAAGGRGLRGLRRPPTTSPDRARPPGLSEHHVGPAQSSSVVQHRRQRHGLHRRRDPTPKAGARDGDAAASTAPRRRRPRPCQPGPRRSRTSRAAGSSRRSTARASSGVRRHRHRGPDRPAAAGLLDPAGATPTSADPRPRPGSSSSPARAADRAVGDAVLVTGQRSRSSTPLGGGPGRRRPASPSPRSPPPLVTKLSSGNVVPPALSSSRRRRFRAPTPAAPGRGVTNVESITTVDPSRSTLEFWEAHEGMLVTVNNVRVVGPGPAAVRRDLRDHQAGAS